MLSRVKDTDLYRQILGITPPWDVQGESVSTPPEGPTSDESLASAPLDPPTSPVSTALEPMLRAGDSVSVAPASP